MELNELGVSDDGAGAEGEGDAVSGGVWRIGGGSVEGSRSAGGEDYCVGEDGLSTICDCSDAASGFDGEVGDCDAGLDVDVGFCEPADERGLDVDAGLVAADVEHSGC